MLHYIYGDELGRSARLRESMFRDRAEQFAARLNWAVTVDDKAFERDEYDLL